MHRRDGAGDTRQPQRGSTDGYTAASVTREALGIARGRGSGRTMHHIRAVGDSLRPQATLPAVARLLDELAVTGK